MRLTPKEFKITGKNLPAVGGKGSVAYKVQKILDDPSQSHTINDAVRTYLYQLTTLFTLDEDRSIYRESMKNVTDFWKQQKSAINPSVNNIKKNFGEILGGIAVTQKELLKRFYKDIKFKNSDLNYPADQREPLKDYSIIMEKEEFIVSAKVTGATSNTVKPGDIRHLINSNPHIPETKRKRLKLTLEYKILDLLDDHNTKVGPGAALAYIGDSADTKIKQKLTSLIPINSFPSMGDYLREFNNKIDKKIGNRYHGSEMEPIYKSNQFKAYAARHNVQKGVPNWGDLSLFFEYVLMNASKKQILDFGDLFIDAVTSQVHFIKMTFNLSTGIPKFDAYASIRLPGGRTITYFNKVSFSLRSKNARYKTGIYSFKGKLGIQV
jgi:hypothetical protein